MNINAMGIGSLNEEAKVKRFLIRIGILKSERAETGFPIVKLSSEEIKDYAELEKEYRKFNIMLKDKAELDALVNAKAMHIKGLKTIWWNNIKGKYKELIDASKHSGIHYDNKAGCIREGLSGDRYKIEE